MSDTHNELTPPSCPEVLNKLISSSLMRARTGGETYVVVSLDERIENVSYKVYPTVADAAPVSGVAFSGELFDKVNGFNHSFVFPVEKKMLYFVVCDMVHHDKEVSVTWLMDPFKRRVVSREDVAPTGEVGTGGGKKKAGVEGEAGTPPVAKKLKK
jgi:hypothetical protein